jgi:hypothetical protein
MAHAPARTCGRPGCCGIVRDNICSHCGPIRTTGWSNDNGSRQQRGYDDAWLALRAEFIREKQREAIESGLSLFPICSACNKPIRGQVHVDHVRAFDGVDDPLRLDLANLRAMHPSCHMRHTAHQSQRTH